MIQNERGPARITAMTAPGGRTVPGRVLIAGTGLIGTSVALALRANGTEVFLIDADPAAAELAAGLGAGIVVPDLRDARSIADVAVLAMPPDAVGDMLRQAQDCAVADVYTDVASVKVRPTAQARALGCDLATYVPGHPLAGLERNGPAAARADLFLGRTWALCPLPETSPDALDAVTALTLACGAVPVATDPATHDRWVAMVSHAPHLVAVAMAARLTLANAPPDALNLAGQGLRDVTRIAAGNSALWTQILSANAGPVADVVAAVAEDLAAAARALAEAGDITALLERGRAGVARIPSLRGSQPDIAHGHQGRDAERLRLAVHGKDVGRGHRRQVPGVNDESTGDQLGALGRGEDLDRVVDGHIRPSGRE